jgi:uncharacterized membrane protein YhiD involved in acid resistance
LAIRPEPWTLGQILVNITLSFLLGLFVAWVYRATHRQLTVSHSFVNTLVIVSMIMTLVIMVIGNNIARAFGLAGAMSIIRFRTVVKDTRDTAFVFYALGAGMAAGTGSVRLAIVGTLLIGFYIALTHLTRHGSESSTAFLLTLDLLPSDSAEERRLHIGVLDRHLSFRHLVSVKSVRNGQYIQLTYQVHLNDPQESDSLVQELSTLEGVVRVGLLQGEEVDS